jgi:hypothetical protein
MVGLSFNTLPRNCFKSLLEMLRLKILVPSCQPYSCCPPLTVMIHKPLQEVFINFGILLGYIASYALSGLPAHLAWRWMVGLGAVPAFFLGVGSLFMPESPRWLVMHGRLQEAARVLLLTSSGDRADAEARLSEIVESVQGRVVPLRGGKAQGPRGGERLARKESGKQEVQGSSPLRPGGVRSRRGSNEEERSGTVPHGTTSIPREAAQNDVSGERGETVDAHRNSVFERRKGEEIARLQRVGAEAALSDGGIELASVRSGAQKSPANGGSPFAALYEPHEGTDAFARGEVDAAGGLEELVTEGGAGGSGVWRELVLHPTPVVRRMLLIGLGCNFFQQVRRILLWSLSGLKGLVSFESRIFVLRVQY